MRRDSKGPPKLLHYRSFLSNCFLFSYSHSLCICHWSPSLPSQDSPLCQPFWQHISLSISLLLNASFFFFCVDFSCFFLFPIKYYCYFTVFFPMVVFLKIISDIKTHLCNCSSVLTPFRKVSFAHQTTSCIISNWGSTINPNLIYLNPPQILILPFEVHPLYLMVMFLPRLTRFP